MSNFNKINNYIKAPKIENVREEEDKEDLFEDFI